MKTKYSLVFVLIITTMGLLVGCAKSNSEKPMSEKPNSDLATQNADLKAQIQKLEQQLQAASNQAASPAAQSSESASVQKLKSQLAEAQKEASVAADKLKSITIETEKQKAKIDELTRQLSAAHQASGKAENAEKALKLYQDATSAIDQFQTLRIALGGQTVEVAGYQQKYLAAKAVVANLANTLPQPEVRQHIMALLSICTQINDVCETADQQMQARTRQAKANYNKFLEFGGLGPNRYVIQIGKDRILAPAKQENAVTARKRDQQVLALEKDLDLGIKDLQALVNS